VKARIYTTALRHEYHLTRNRRAFSPVLRRWRRLCEHVQVAEGRPRVSATTPTGHGGNAGPGLAGWRILLQAAAVARNLVPS